MHHRARSAAAWSAGLGLSAAVVILAGGAAATTEPSRDHRSSTGARTKHTTPSPTTGLELVGRWPYGSLRAVTTAGNLVYFGSGAVLEIADLADPAQPQVLAEIVFPEIVEGVAVAGRYAYVADGGAGLRVVDVLDPAAPVEVGVAQGLLAAREVVVAGDDAYVADDFAKLAVVDVSTPWHPYRVARVDMAGAPRGLAVADGHAFVAVPESGLHVIDVTTPTAPVEVGRVEPSGRPSSVAVVGDVAYLGTTQGLVVVDASVPGAPVVVGALQSGAVSDVAVAEDLAYVARRWGLWVIDVSTPTSPAEVGFVANIYWGIARRVAVADERAYVATYDLAGSVDGSNLVAIDIGTPAAPTAVGVVEQPGFTAKVTIAGGHAYVVGYPASLHVIDLENPRSPVEVGVASGPEMEAVDVAVEGAYAYMVARTYTYFLVVFDVGVPGHPFRVAQVTLPDTVTGIAVADHHAFMTSLNQGLRVFDLSTPTAPLQVGFVATPGHVSGVTVTGDHAYVAAGYRGLRVIDVSVPSGPVEVGHVDGLSLYGSLAVADGHTYAISLPDSSSNALLVFDVGTPTSPVEVGSIAIEPSASQIAVANGFAYVASDTAVEVIDVATPAAPFAVGSVTPAAGVSDVASAGGLVFVAERDAGFEVFRPLGFADGFESGDTSTWSATVVNLADAFDFLLAGRGITGDYVACSYDPGQQLYYYLGQAFSELDGGLGGIPIVTLEDLYWKNESLASSVPPYDADDADGDGTVNSADGDAFDPDTQSRSGW